MTSATSPPSITDITGEWMPAGELVNLPSIRSPFGQGHVNADLTSLSWLALPPITVGYQTGVLKLDGDVVAAERFRWLPWGVERQATVESITIVSDTRFTPHERAILWRTTVTNDSPDVRTVSLSQELAAMSATSEVDWGWLYGAPWNHGHYHDFYATEKIRSQVLTPQQGQTHLLRSGERLLRLGKPRTPGLQRDEEGIGMILDDALPAHTTSDRVTEDLPGAPVTVSALRISGADGVASDFVFDDIAVPSGADVVVGSAALHEGSIASLEFQLNDSTTSGVIFTHGNHPDSLQLGLTDGAPWMSVGGEIVRSGEPLRAGSHTLTAKVSAAGTELTVDADEAISTNPWWESTRWNARLAEGLTVTDRSTGAVAQYGFATIPDSVDLEGSRAVGTWIFTLEPGQSQLIEIALDLGNDRPDRGIQIAHEFDQHFAGARAWWEYAWQSAFTPDNDEFSGYLPLLAASEDLEKTYYTAALELLYVRNKVASPIGSVYLSGGPRLGPTTTFYWDLAEISRVLALLDPRALRSWILAALSVPYDESLAFDAKNLLPIGNHYSANDYSLFRAVESYVGVTGDLSILRENAAGRSVFEHIREMAFRPELKRASFGEGILVDFGGDAWELLEAVPNYRHVVVSLNAGYVGILRRFATLATLLGLDDDAAHAADVAGELAGAVIRQYAGEGRWRISHPDHDEVIGHCIDFQFVAGEMSQDLTETMKSEMVAFVSEHLLDGDWMRALSPDDPIAPFSDRVDHGPDGAYGAWPADTAYGLTQIGYPKIAVEFLSRVHRSTSGGLWGQAQEARGDGTYFVCESGCHCRDLAAGASMAEAIIAGLFGIQGDFAALNSRRGGLDFEGGRLHNVRAIGFDLRQPGNPDSHADRRRRTGGHRV